MQSILKAHMGQPPQDWVQIYASRQQEAAKRRKPPASNDNWQGTGTVLRPLTDYTGVYQDPWFGKIDIKMSGKTLRFRSYKSKQMKGRLEPFDQNTFIARWDNRSFDADAYVRFATDFKGKISNIEMRPVLDGTDFSFDFQDLNFTRLGE